MTSRVMPLSSRVMLSVTIAWVRLSSALVASSSIRMRGVRTMARAIRSR